MNLSKWLRFINEALLAKHIIWDDTDKLPKPYLQKIQKMGEIPLYAPIVQNADFDPFIEPCIVTLWVAYSSILDRNTIEQIDGTLSDIEPELVVDFSEVKTHSELMDIINQVNCHIAVCSEVCSAME
jgi:hypothetical protein